MYVFIYAFVHKKCIFTNPPFMKDPLLKKYFMFYQIDIYVICYFLLKRLWL